MSASEPAELFCPSLTKRPSEPSSVASSSMGSELGWDPWACIGSSASACFLEPVFFLTAGHFLPYDRSDTSKIAESFSVLLRCPGAEWKSGPATSTYSTALVHRNDVLFLEEDSEAVVIVLCKSDLPQNIKPFPFPLSDPKQDEEQFLQGLCGLRVLFIGSDVVPYFQVTLRGTVVGEDMGRDLLPRPFQNFWKACLGRLAGKLASGQLGNQPGDERGVAAWQGFQPCPTCAVCLALLDSGCRWKDRKKGPRSSNI